MRGLPRNHCTFTHVRTQTRNLIRHWITSFSFVDNALKVSQIQSFASGFEDDKQQN